MCRKGVPKFLQVSVLELAVTNLVFLTQIEDNFSTKIYDAGITSVAYVIAVYAKPINSNYVRLIFYSSCF